jgi:pre-mRNA-splicing factor SPF27
VARGAPLEALDLVRYSLNKPDASNLGDLERAWQAALDNAHSQLQHQDNRLLNLELLLKYGPNAWRAQNEALSSHLSHLQTQLTSTRQAVDALNQERKLQQTAAGKELGVLESEYLSLVTKNKELEAECKRLEAEVSKGQEADGAQ